MVEEYVIYVVLQNHFRISTHWLHYIKGNYSKHNVVNSFSSISTWRHSNALLLLGILSCVNDRRTNLHELILFLIYRLLYCTVRFLTYTRVWIDLVNVAEKDSTCRKPQVGIIDELCVSHWPKVLWQNCCSWCLGHLWHICENSRRH